MAARILVFLLEACAPIFWLTGLVFRSLYKVFFSWWLNPAFERWAQKSFAEEIKQAMPFLFGQYGAKVVPDPKPQGNHASMGYVCLATGTLIFKFARWHRENYAVQVAPMSASTDLYDLLDVLRVTDPTANTKNPLLDTSWRPFGKLLEPRFHLVEQALDAEHFSDTKRQIAQLR